MIQLTGVCFSFWLCHIFRKLYIFNVFVIFTQKPINTFVKNYKLLEVDVHEQSNFFSIGIIL